MKLSDWAKQQGVCYKTAWLWFHGGTLPVKARQLATGTIILEEYPVDANEERSLICASVRFRTTV